LCETLSTLSTAGEAAAAALGAGTAFGCGVELELGSGGGLEWAVEGSGGGGDSLVEARLATSLLALVASPSELVASPSKSLASECRTREWQEASSRRSAAVTALSSMDSTCDPPAIQFIWGFQALFMGVV
jgi:hypothetical protein